MRSTCWTYDDPAESPIGEFRFVSLSKHWLKYEIACPTTIALVSHPAQQVMLNFLSSSLPSGADERMPSHGFVSKRRGCLYFVTGPRGGPRRGFRDVFYMLDGSQDQLTLACGENDLPAILLDVRPVPVPVLL